MPQLIAPHHIEPGIKKYQGVIDHHLQQLINNAKLEYTPYVFNDGRILLVMPCNLSAFLYANKEELYAKLSLE